MIKSILVKGDFKGWSVKAVNRQPFCYDGCQESSVYSPHLYASFGTCASNNWPIWTQKVPKRSASVKIWTTNFYKIFFHKYFVLHEWSAVKNALSMLYPGWFILIESIFHEQQINEMFNFLPKMRDYSWSRKILSRVHDNIEYFWC